jgi:Xaa-Pro dipeptidase
MHRDAKGGMKDPTHQKRAEKLRKKLAEENLRGAIIVPGPNMRYFTGVESFLLERPFMLLVPVRGEVQLVSPALEAGPYRRVPFRIEVHAWTDSEGPGNAISSAARAADMKGRWGVEGRAPFMYLDALAKKATVKLENAEHIFQSMREVKDGAEVRLLRRSAAILSSAFEEFPSLVKEGISELDLARKATDVTYAKGASKVDPVLVQSGLFAADPHHMPGSRKLARGDGVVIDVGSTFGGYYADITRTFCIGQSKETEKVYTKVLEAQISALGKAAEGAEVGSVDSGARDVLKKAGMGEYFVHRTGHGLGLEIHEAPYIVEGGEERLGRNMCFTVEPGAYVKGKLGVRIEDDVLIEGRKGVAITDTPKEFGWWM